MAQEDVTDKKKTTSSGDKSKSKAKEAPPAKVVIRRLPPSMTEEMFLEQVSPIPDHDFFYYVAGDPGIGLQSFSRAYINFTHQDDIFMFQEKFDGYVFIDQKGNEFTAIVEFAPYQKIPKFRDTVKPDDKCDTIENDPEYFEFLKKLENPEEVSLPTIETYLEQLEIKERERKANKGFVKVVTPLVEYIENKRHEREKLREERREERRKRELERKKARDAERSKRKDKREKEKGDKDGSRKTDEKKPVKLLKNAERDQNVDASTKVGERKDELKLRDVAAVEEKPKERGKRDDEKRKDRPRERTRQPKNDKPKVARDAAVKEPRVDKFKDRDEGSKKAEEPVAITKPSEESVEKKQAVGTDDIREEGKERREGKPDRKVRNKDRPALEIYRPGARRSTTQKGDDLEQESGGSSSKQDVKTRTFTRSTSRK